MNAGKVLHQNKFLSEAKDKEQVLSTRVERLFAHSMIHGLSPTENMEDYKALIEKEHFFYEHSLRKDHSFYKEIVPYILISNNGKLLLMKRKSNHREGRLKNRYAIGMGGFIRPQEFSSLSSPKVTEWIINKFEKQFSFKGTFTIHSVGIVHEEEHELYGHCVGMVFLIKCTGSLSELPVRDTNMQCSFASLKECSQVASSMEWWSQIILDFLKTSPSFLK